LTITWGAPGAWADASLATMPLAMSIKTPTRPNDLILAYRIAVLSRAAVSVRSPEHTQFAPCIQSSMSRSREPRARRLGDSMSELCWRIWS
jgi:hypothetical protein